MLAPLELAICDAIASFRLWAVATRFAAVDIFSFPLWWHGRADPRSVGHGPANWACLGAWSAKHALFQALGIQYHWILTRGALARQLVITADLAKPVELCSNL